MLKKYITQLFERWIIGVAIALTLMLGSAGFGIVKVYVDVPEDIRMTNERITTDSLIAAQQLHDSIALFRSAMDNLRQRIADVESDNRKVKSKLKIK